MTNLTGSANFVKYLLFLLNFIFVITGIIILSIGATVQGIYHGYAHFLSDQFFSVPALLIAIGALIFFIAFFGCCGAIKENYCMVMTFAVLLGLIFILEFAAGISGYVLRNNTNELLTNTLTGTMQQYNKTNFDYITALWDEVQKDFSCCGAKKYDEWYPILNGLLPMSCCSFGPGAIGSMSCTNETLTLFTTGCAPAFGEFIRAHAVSLGAAGLSIALFQLIGIFITCFLARKIKNPPMVSSGHNQF